MTDDGWTVTPKPSPPELREGFEPTRYDGSVPHENDHIRDWASFVELAGEEGMKALAKAVR